MEGNPRNETALSGPTRDRLALAQVIDAQRHVSEHAQTGGPLADDFDQAIAVQIQSLQHIGRRQIQFRLAGQGIEGNHVPLLIAGVVVEVEEGFDPAVLVDVGECRERTLHCAAMAGDVQFNILPPVRLNLAFDDIQRFDS